LLLVPNFFTNIALEQTKKSEYGSDLALEIEDAELVEKFKEFYNDVVPEFELFGKLEQFRVCRNFFPHLRGNTYIEYEHQR
jgi:U2 small nuclear ribonucleoprotein auxiliary factor 35 kDa subunit-related protein